MAGEACVAVWKLLCLELTVGLALGACLDHFSILLLDLGGVSLPGSPVHHVRVLFFIAVLH